MAPITVTAHAEEGADPLALVDGLVKDKLRADLASGSGEAVANDIDADKPKDDESEDATTVDLEESSEDEAPEADEAEAEAEEEAAEADRASLGLGGRRESKLFAEESRAHESPSGSPRALSLDSLNEGGDDALVPPPESAFAPGLSLMASSSPASSYSSPGSGFGLGDPLGVPPLFDETKWIQSQIDADEALARQLQEEEEERKRKFKPRASRAKPNVVPSRWDAWLGEPMRHEVRHNYSRVPRAAANNADSDADSPPRPRSCAESAGDLGLSALTGAFRSWGSSVTAAATDFFGEDIKMQVKGPRGASSPSGRFRNEV